MSDEPVSLIDLPALATDVAKLKADSVAVASDVKAALADLGLLDRVNKLLDWVETAGGVRLAKPLE